jgi:hypothetical protein
MKTIMRLLILFWIAKDMRKKKKKKKLRRKKALLAKKQRMKKAAIRKQKREEKRRTRQVRMILSDSNKKALKRALPFIAVGSAMWLLLTSGAARRRTAHLVAMRK